MKGGGGGGGGAGGGGVGGRFSIVGESAFEKVPSNTYYGTYPTYQNTEIIQQFNT